MILIIVSNGVTFWYMNRIPPQLKEPNYFTYYKNQDLMPEGKVGIFISHLIMPEDMEPDQFHFIAMKTKQYIPWPMRFLFEKDKGLIELANKYNLAYIGLSFVRTKEDIVEAKKLITSDSIIISKVETLAAVKNLVEILTEVEYILIDRGDLSTEIGLVKVPAYQDYIIDKAVFHGKKVFLATQFLKSMELNPVPTIPEVIDLYNTLKKGIYGIQMSEETAVGKYPKLCLDTIAGLIDEINEERIV